MGRGHHHSGRTLVHLEKVTPGLPALPGNARLIAGVFFLSAWLSGCALIVPQTDKLHEAWPGDLPRRVELENVPFFPQQDYECGPAALAMTPHSSSPL